MTMGEADDRACWYAVRTKSQEEDRADSNLRSWQVQTFAPKLKERRTSGYDHEYVSKPLFSRYIFARFDITRQLHDINYTRGVQNVVSFGGCFEASRSEVVVVVHEGTIVESKNPSVIEVSTRLISVLLISDKGPSECGV